MSETRQIDTGYRPREHQAEVHRALKRFSVLVCHRRFGKTVLAVNQLIHGALTCEKDRPRLAYIAPLYRQAKQVAWDYLKAFSAPIPGHKVNESELRVDYPNGSRVTLYGADNPESLRGIYLDGCVLDEYGDMRPSLMSEVIRPALTDRAGWMLVTGTPKGPNHFRELYEHAVANDEWFSGLYKVSQTGIVPESELDAARALMSEDQYDREFECSFEAAVEGAYYGHEMRMAAFEERIGNVPHETGTPVTTAWDLGISDDTVIWFAQKIGREVRIIDYYQNHGMAIDHYAQVIQRKPYVYEEHILPHDADKRELGSGVSIADQLRNLGVKNIRTLPQEPIALGIQRARVLIGKAWFDAQKCADGINALRQYRRDWDEKNQCFRDKPLHDWASHPADGFRYLAMGWQDELIDDAPRDRYARDRRTRRRSAWAA